jgi:23S rRNA (cytosine1962-C5)-methyltransferase
MAALMGRAVADALGVPAQKIHLKQRWAGWQDGKRYERIDRTDRKIVLCERDLKFLVNPTDYVDTGLFSDHRDTRQMIRGWPATRIFSTCTATRHLFPAMPRKAGPAPPSPWTGQKA